MIDTSDWRRHPHKHEPLMKHYANISTYAVAHEVVVLVSEQSESTPDLFKARICKHCGVLYVPPEHLASV